MLSKQEVEILKENNYIISFNNDSFIIELNKKINIKDIIFLFFLILFFYIIPVYEALNEIPFHYLILLLALIIFVSKQFQIYNWYIIINNKNILRKWVEFLFVMRIKG